MMKRSITIDFLVKDASNKNFLVDEGFMPLGKIPSRNFIPDFSKLVKKIDDIYQLGELFKDMDDSQSRILIAALYYSSRLAKFNLHFAQPIYFNVSAPTVDFVDCWYKGYAVAATRKKYSNQFGEKSWDYHIIAISNLKRDWETTLHLLPGSILTKEQFKKHKKKLIAEGKFRAPKINLQGFSQDWASVSDEDADAGKVKDVPESDLLSDLKISLDSAERLLIKKYNQKKKRDKRAKKKKGKRGGGQSARSITLIDETQKYA